MCMYDGREACNRSTLPEALYPSLLSKVHENVYTGLWLPCASPEEMSLVVECLKATDECKFSSACSCRIRSMGAAANMMPANSYLVKATV